jgi:CubicO group peptidase (beta-lactamase class C family)
MQKALITSVVAAVLFAIACKGEPLAAREQAPDVEPPAAPVDTIAVSAAATRLHELLAVVNGGDAAAMKAYLEAHSADHATSSVLLPTVLNLHRLSHGLDLVRVATIGTQQIQPQWAGHIAGILRNRATGDEQVLAIAVPPAPAAVHSEQDQLQEIGSYLKRLADADIFSGVVVIARDGQPVFSQAYGYADRERKIPNTLSTPFLLGSLNKLFTGLAIGQLVERGKLSYDDPLSKFLPDYPDPESAKQIQIKHLLSHTSGLATGFTSKAYHDSLDRMVTVQALLDAGDRQPPKFKPGTQWAYSNFGFVLLGRIIEIVTGEDYYEYMLRNVFAPAGMTSASFPMLPRTGVATVPMAYPYEVEFTGERLLYANKLGAEFRRGGPSCCGVASALDLMALAKALPSGQVVKPETFHLHSTAKPELGAPYYGYGFAVGIRRSNDRLLVGHGGNASGQCTEFGSLRGTPYTITVLSNLTIGTCVSVNGKIMRVLAASQASPG